MRLVNTETGHAIYRFPKKAEDIAYSRYGKRLVFWTDDPGDNRPEVHVVSLKDGRLEDPGPITSVIGPVTAASVSDNTLDWIIESEQAIQGLAFDPKEPHAAEPRVVRHLSKRGKFGNWVTGLADGSVAFGTSLYGIPAHAAPVTDICIAAEDKTMITVSSDGNARLWDMANRQPTLSLLRAGNAKLSCSRDGSFVLSGLRPIKLWDTAIGREIVRFDTGADVRAAVLSPNGKHVAAVEGKRVVIWSIPENKTAESSVAQRNPDFLAVCMNNGRMGAWTPPQLGQRRGSCVVPAIDAFTAGAELSGVAGMARPARGDGVTPVPSTHRR
jgi:WD40 repeat protein